MTIRNIRGAFHKFRLNSIFSRILLTIFSGMLLIVMLAMLFYFTRTYQASKDSREQLIHSYVESVSSSSSIILVDNLAQEINNLANSYYLLELIYYTQPTASMINYALTNLKVFSTGNIYIDSIVVSIPRHDIVLDSMYRSYSLDNAPYINLISSFTNYRPGYVVESNNKRSRFFCFEDEYYLARNFVLQENNNLATIFFHINMHQFYKAISKELPGYIQLYIYNDKNSTVFPEDVDYSSIGLSEKEMQSLLTQNPNSLQKNKFTYFYYPASQNGWSFIAKIESSHFIPQIGSLLQLLLPILVITLTGAIVVSIIISIVIYNPLRHMFNSVMTGLTDHGNASKNEIDYVTYAFSEVNASVRHLEGILDSLTPDIIGRIFSGLLNNKSPGYQYVKTALQSINSVFKFDDIYVVAAIAFPFEFELGAEEFVDGSNFKKINSVLSAFNTRTNTHSFVKYMEEKVVAIVTSFDANADINDAHKVIDQLEALLNECLNKDSIEILYARGHFYHSILDVTASYNRAAGLIRQARGVHKSSSHADESSQSNLPGILESDVTPSLGAEDPREALKYQVFQILTNIEVQNPVEAKSILMNIFEDLHAHKPICDNETISLMSFLDIFTEMLEEKYLVNENILNRSRILQEKCRNPGEAELVDLLAETKRLSEELIDQAQCHYKSTQNQYLLKAKAYIQTNYTDPSLSLETISDECSITPNYLSKLFVSSGINYSEYIGQLRILKSVSLLKESDMTIKEIATACGFNSPQSFIRVFKKQVGDTPGKFREF